MIITRILSQAACTAALVAAGKARDFLEGVRQATRSIDSGAARDRLDAFVAFTQAEGQHAAEAASNT